MSSSSGREAMYAKASRQRSRVDPEVDLLDLVGVDADGVAARAEAAVDGAGVEREEQRLVGVAVGEAGHRRVGLLVERIEAELAGDRGGAASATGMNCLRSGSS